VLAMVPTMDPSVAGRSNGKSRIKELGFAGTRN